MKKMGLFMPVLPVIFLLALATTGCVVGVAGPPPVAVGENVIAYYDNPVRGWYVEGYWTGGCLNCGIWIAPFWTTDIILLHEHFAHYHGSYRSHIERYFNRHQERFRGHPGVHPQQRPQHQQQHPQVHPQQRPSQPHPSQPKPRQPHKPPQKDCKPNQKC